MPKILYTGLFLSATGKDSLLRKVEPRYELVHAHHCTLYFNPKSLHVDLVSRFGETFDLDLDFEVWGDPGVQAVSVRIPSDLVPHTSPGKKTHITISTGPGAKPVDSNLILETLPNVSRLMGSVKARLGYFDGKVRFDPPSL